MIECFWWILITNEPAVSETLLMMMMIGTQTDDNSDPYQLSVFQKS